VLYSGEIYNLTLDADLVVLSACESGLGKVVRGEGILGLTRGFLYAGARNVVVSLWQVADKSTADLMVEFYRNVLNGESFSAALRNAKLALIKAGKYAYPLEWSPFVLVGR
jgi:CHAT domain-containing protein